MSISECLFAEHCVDIFSDVSRYLELAAKDAPCEKCDGTGKKLLPEGQAAQEHEILFALMYASGAKGNHTFPGDPCIWCGGFGVDEKKQRAIAARFFAHDWLPTMRELFDPLSEENESVAGVLAP